MPLTTTAFAHLIRYVAVGFRVRSQSRLLSKAIGNPLRAAFIHLRMCGAGGAVPPVRGAPGRGAGSRAGHFNRASRTAESHACLRWMSAPSGPLLVNEKRRS